MSQANNFIEKSTNGACCPYCQRADLVYKHDESTLSCVQCNRPVASVYIDENRLDWLVRGWPEFISKELEKERIKYDEWSSKKNIDSNRYRDCDLDSWLASSVPMRWVKNKAPILSNVRGQRILDIGGSCQDSWRFVKSGAERLDQVEPSSGSQRLAMRRLNAAFDDIANWQEHVFFHTSAAEALPFADNVFDIVFSRATIHHTQRRHSIKEIHRVLRPGGVMFIIEPRLTVPFYFLMKLSRWLRRVDRGTDDPLRPSEIRAIKRLFGTLHCYTTGVGIEKVEWLVRKLSGQSINPGTLITQRWEDRIGQIPFFSNILGGKCYIISEKVNE